MLKREEWGKLNFNFIIICLNTKMCTFFKTKHDLHNRGYFFAFFQECEGKREASEEGQTQAKGEGAEKINNTNNKNTENRIQ